ncbi:hypothetical protein TEA_014780 [Camellia sinensis var. sinensis]|uniref:RRM domain-containing protein n=1 Tax=Camellia sinensis var. sinensis TaxID=542762 RepID=A0A4S4EM04_CAMSN|nr:hypothetical protein TEA_014780 [Camellia sinensis var. sinensis]
MGDSLVDNGNNNELVTTAKSNYPPYGIDFPDGPTGRFSNGQNKADIIESMGTRGLYTIFSNYGVVMDPFIPNKRRKMTRSRVGFVRYNCSTATDMAVKGTGAWYDDRALRVKIAEFGKESGPQPRLKQAPQNRKAIANNTTYNAGYQRNRPIVEVVRGRGVHTNAIRTIKAYEEGNG